MNATSAPVHPKRLPTVSLLGLRVHAVSEAGAVEHVLDAIDAVLGGAVVTPNLDHLRRWTRDPEFRALVDRADVVVADGAPLVWASRIAGTPLPEVVAGSNLISSLSRGAAMRGRSVFLLGGAAGAAEGAARVLVSGTATLRVAGTWFPPLGFEDDPVELARMESALASAGPDIVFVGLGSPKQERLIERLRCLLPRSWWLGVGISFSYLNGDVRRAPVWMRRVGLEWLHRVLSEPRRLARRYLIEGIPFGLRLLGWAVARRVRA